MTTNNFAASLDSYKKWRDDLVNAISDYQLWADQQEYVDGQQECIDGERELRFLQLTESLKSDKLVIALVGEFSRGKTELLNSIFFPDYKQRLLPSAAGRTTMCPTELRYDEKDGPCIKLLAIETRKTTQTISEYKNTPVHWTKLHILKRGSQEEMREAFLEVTKTKKVSIREAQELGLWNPEAKETDQQQPVDGMVEIPVWRHAIINFPHPLLEQGLVILDTPGLNALGAEPELTLNMLPNAHAVLFLLAADIGVTKTDMEIWNSYLNEDKKTKGQKHIVVLNKIDALWDELHDEEKISKTLARQVEKTVQTLKVDKKFIFPVSAQKGLLGKISGDSALVEKSGLLMLEKKLAQDIVPLKHEIIRRKIVYEISGHIEESRTLFESRLGAATKQISKLQELGGKNLDVIQKMVTRMRIEKKKYDKEVQGLNLTRETLTKQAKNLSGYLSMDSLDKLIVKTRKDMQESWTTHGMKRGMETFFKGMMASMDQVKKEADEIMGVVEGIYYRLHKEYGLNNIKPASLSVLPYFMELSKLQLKAETFRNSPVTVMTEQNYVIQRFFITLVSQGRNIFDECNASVRNWFQGIMSPVFVQVQEHKATIERDLESLKNIHENMDGLGTRIAELEGRKKKITEQLKVINGLLQRIHDPISQL